MYKVKPNDASNDEETVVSNIKTKMVMITIYELPDDEKESWAVPLLHDD